MPDQKIPKVITSVEFWLESNVAKNDGQAAGRSGGGEGTLAMGRREHLDFWTIDAGESYVGNMYYISVASS